MPWGTFLTYVAQGVILFVILFIVLSAVVAVAGEFKKKM